MEDQLYMASSMTPMGSARTLKDDSGKKFLQEKQHPRCGALLGPHRDTLSSSYPKGTFQERLLDYKALFHPHNSEHDKWELFPLKDCLMFKPQDNFYFKYLLFFSSEFNLPFKLFKGFDLAAKWNLSFSLVNIRAQNSSFKIFTMCFPPFGFDLFVSL